MKSKSLEQTKLDYECGRDCAPNTPPGEENFNDAETTNKHTPVHTLLLPLQAGRDVSVSVGMRVCMCVLCSVFVNQALLNLKIITFTANQHHGRRTARAVQKGNTLNPRE